MLCTVSLLDGFGGSYISCALKDTEAFGKHMQSKGASRFF